MGGLGDFFKGAVDFIPIVGDVISGISSAKEAKKNREFQQYMSDTAHQREVKDLRAAGLNPILSGTGGGGASTPSGSVADVPDYGGGVASALQGKKQRELMNAQIDQANAAAAYTRSQTDGQNLDNTDRQNEIDAKWGTGNQKDGTYMASFRATQAETVQRILESRQRTSSAKETSRKEKLLNDVLDQDPELRKWVLSASKQEYDTINRALDDNRNASDVIKAIRAVLR